VFGVALVGCGEPEKNVNKDRDRPVPSDQRKP
jgi:hypothetical protein